MSARVLWPIAGLFGLGLLTVALTTQSSAQRPAVDRPAAVERPVARAVTFGPGPGRFTVAHATEKQIVILDTATGQLYKATADDFKKFSELPKVGVGVRAPAFGREKDAPRRGTEKEKRGVNPRRDREKKDGATERPKERKKEDPDAKRKDRAPDREPLRGTDRKKEEPKRGDRKPDEPRRNR